MPTDGRKTITVPEPIYEKFVTLHQKIRPHDSCPHWWSIDEIVTSYEHEE